MAVGRNFGLPTWNPAHRRCVREKGLWKGLSKVVGLLTPSCPLNEKSVCVNTVLRGVLVMILRHHFKVKYYFVNRNSEFPREVLSRSGEECLSIKLAYAMVKEGQLPE